MWIEEAMQVLGDRGWTVLWPDQSMWVNPPEVAVASKGKLSYKVVSQCGLAAISSLAPDGCETVIYQYDEIHDWTSDSIVSIIEEEEYKADLLCKDE